jgi:hypothetical protein
MRTSLLLLALAAAACGGTTSGVTTADVQRFSATAQSVASAATAYGSQAAGMTDVAACASGESSYDGQVRPMIGQMAGMGPGMDDKMASMGHMSDSDMACGTGAMMAELDRHRAAACASPTDMAPNRAEAQQHVTAMVQWANHERVRAQEMGGMMGMGGMGGSGTTGHCVHNPDGSYSMLP